MARFVPVQTRVSSSELFSVKVSLCTNVSAFKRGRNFPLEARFFWFCLIPPLSKSFFLINAAWAQLGNVSSPAMIPYFFNSNHPFGPVWRCDDKQKNLDKDTTPSWNVALVPYLKKSNGARCLFLKNNSWSSPLVTPVPFLLLTPNHNNREQKHAFRKSLSSAVIIRPDMPGVSFTRKGSYVSKYGP